MSENTFKGIILWGVGGLYGVRPYPEISVTDTDISEDGGVYVCRARGVFRHEGLTPLPGDSVTVSREGVTADGSPAGVIDAVSSE